MAFDVIATQSFSFRDVQGHVARVRFNIAYGSGAPDEARDLGAALLTALAVVYGANLVCFKASGPYAANFDSGLYPTPAGGEKYIAAEDKILFDYLCGVSGGAAHSGVTVHRCEIPAPLVANFTASDRIWANANQTAFGTVLKTANGDSFVSNRSGQPVIHVLGGKRIERRLQRKITAYTKTPDLAGWEQ